MLNKEAFVKGFTYTLKEKRGFGLNFGPSLSHLGGAIARNPIKSTFGGLSGLLGLNTIANMGNTGASIGKNISGPNLGWGTHNALERTGVNPSWGEALGRLGGSALGVGSEAASWLMPGIGKFLVPAGLNVGSNLLNKITGLGANQGQG